MGKLGIGYSAFRKGQVGKGGISALFIKLVRYPEQAIRGITCAATECLYWIGGGGDWRKWRVILRVLAA